MIFRRGMFSRRAVLFLLPSALFFCFRLGPSAWGGEGASSEDSPLLKGLLYIDVSDDEGRTWPARVEFHLEGEDELGVIEVPSSGVREVSLPGGAYTAYVHAYTQGIPVLVEIQEFAINAEKPENLPILLTAAELTLESIRTLDSDGDLALDRVEVAHGTNPNDNISIPGRLRVPLPPKALAGEAGWYRGELYAHSTFGRGRESVAQLIRRAEKAKLDFLAITDSNTMQSVFIPEYQSKKVVLIPAMEWGTDELGYALIYGPRTVPGPPGSIWAAQAECVRVQAQGGVFAVARPCRAEAPWQWGLSRVNAIQVWCGPWRDVAPMSVDDLQAGYRQRAGRRGRYVYSIAQAAASAEKAARVGESMGKAGMTYSANDQAALYWDYEVARNLMVSAIGGSHSDSGKASMGTPVTYVYAKEKSLPGILEGLRLGRTFVSSGLDGPRIDFKANVMGDGAEAVGIGGVVPLNVDITLEMHVVGGKGLKLQLLENGDTVSSFKIEKNSIEFWVKRRPDTPAAYRIQVVGAPKSVKRGYGPLEVHAISSPIYARDLNRRAVEREQKEELRSLMELYLRINPDMPAQVLH